MATLSSLYKQSPLPEAGLVSVVAFVVYIATCAPSLMYTDAGELAAVAHTFGVAHPTGYPLFTLITHCWTLIWQGVYGLNVLAAVWVAASVGTLYLAQRALVGMIFGEEETSSPARIACAASSLTLAFSTIVWAQATSIEVYSLQLLLTSLALWSAVQSVTDADRAAQWSVLTGLFAGCMMANHLSSVFILPGLGIVWLAANRQQKLRSWYVLVLPALAGVALYLVLPLRSAQHPELNWGMVHRNWDAFVYHVKGTQFGVWM
ncbi:MAG: protein O-mannosyl-transferase family, partial [Ignavibacteria bacterium]